MPSGAGFIVIDAVAFPAEQVLAESVSRTVYVPATEACIFISPVIESITKPDEELNIPALPPPITVGKGLAPF